MPILVLSSSTKRLPPTAVLSVHWCCLPFALDANDSSVGCIAPSSEYSIRGVSLPQTTSVTTPCDPWQTSTEIPFCDIYVSGATYTPQHNVGLPWPCQLAIFLNASFGHQNSRSNLHFALRKNISGIFELPPTLLKIFVHRDGDI